jgi:hypothetical protein
VQAAPFGIHSGRAGQDVTAVAADPTVGYENKRIAQLNGSLSATVNLLKKADENGAPSYAKSHL